MIAIQAPDKCNSLQLGPFSFEVDLIQGEPPVDLSRRKSASRVITNCLKTRFERGCRTNPVIPICT